MTVTRHMIYVEQTIGNETFVQKSVAYNITSSNYLMNQLMRMDMALYRTCGAVLPSRTWRVEELELG